MRLSIVPILALSICFSVSAGQISSLQQKLVEISLKTLKKSRDPGERREAVRDLAGVGSAEVVPHIVSALSDPDPTVRRQAADSLWRISDVAGAAEPALREALSDSSPGVQVRAASALDSLGVPEEELVSARQAGLRAEKLRDRILASRGLIGFVDGELLVPPVLEVAAEEAETSSYSLGKTFLSPTDILDRMVRHSDPSYLPPTLSALREVVPGAGHLAKGLEKLEPKPEDWTEILVGLLVSPRMGDQAAALGLLRERVGDADGVALWIEPVTGVVRIPDLTIDATYALQFAGGHAASSVPTLLKLLEKARNESHRKRAAQAIEEIGDADQAFPTATMRQVAEISLEPLSRAARTDPDAGVRGAAANALKKLLLSPEELLPVLLDVIENDVDGSNRRTALWGIRDLGTDGGAAESTLERLIASGVEDEVVYQQALDSVRTGTPRRHVEIDGTAGGDSGDSAAAMAALRAAGVDFSTHSLYLALSNREVDHVTHFLDAGMGVDQRVDESTGMRPLHALFFGNGCPIYQATPPETKTLTRLLIERGADVNIPDDRGNTPLKLAAMGCDGDVIGALLEAGADPAAADPHGMTAFELAVGLNEEAAEALLDAGFRLTQAKAADYRKAYADNPGALALLERSVGP